MKKLTVTAIVLPTLMMLLLVSRWYLFRHCYYLELEQQLRWIQLSLRVLLFYIPMCAYVYTLATLIPRWRETWRELLLVTSLYLVFVLTAYE